MARILIIEFLLGGILGAIVFRLAWEFTKSKRIAWVVVALVIVVVLVLGAGKLEYIEGWSSPPHLDLHVIAVAFGLDRAFGWLLGSGLASFIVSKREKTLPHDEDRYLD